MKFRISYDDVLFLFEKYFKQIIKFPKVVPIKHFLHINKKRDDDDDDAYEENDDDDLVDLLAEILRCFTH